MILISNYSECLESLLISRFQDPILSTTLSDIYIQEKKFTVLFIDSLTKKEIKILTKDLYHENVKEKLGKVSTKIQDFSRFFHPIKNKNVQCAVQTLNVRHPLYGKNQFILNEYLGIFMHFENKMEIFKPTYTNNLENSRFFF